LGILTAVAEQGLPVSKAVLNRLSLTLAAVSLRTPGGTTTFVQQALAYGNQGVIASAGAGAGAGATSTSSSALRVGLELLRQLPSELEASDLPRQRKGEIAMQELQPQLEGVFVLVSACLDASTAAAATEQEANSFATEAQKCCIEWVGLSKRTAGGGVEMPVVVGLAALSHGGSAAGRGLFERLLQRLAGGGGGGGGGSVAPADSAAAVSGSTLSAAAEAAKVLEAFLLVR
jgi:hypothetical protein